MEKIMELVGAILEIKERIKDWFRTNRRVLVFLGLVLLSLIGMWHLFGWWFILAGVIGGLSYCIWNYEDVLNTRIQDWFNPLKWGSVVYASFMKLLFPMHIVEQLILRMYDEECRKCMDNGKCLHCQCDMSKVFTPWDVCSRGFWGPMMESEKEYRKMRKEWPVEIKVNYVREAKKQ